MVNVNICVDMLRQWSMFDIEILMFISNSLYLILVDSQNYAGGLLSSRVCMSKVIVKFQFLVLYDVATSS